MQVRTAELEQSRQRYRDLAELLPQMVFEVDTNGHLVYVNFQALPTFGYAKEELEGRPYDEVIAPQDRARLAEDAQRLLNGEQGNGRGECCFGRRRDGSEVPIFIRAATMKRQGVIVGFRGVVIDLTEPFQEALRQSEEKYRRLFESLTTCYLHLHRGRKNPGGKRGILQPPRLRSSRRGHIEDRGHICRSAAEAPFSQGVQGNRIGEGLCRQRSRKRTGALRIASSQPPRHTQQRASRPSAKGLSGT